MSAQTDFNAAYWPAQPPAVQALQAITDINERTKDAMNLASQGYAIDVPIMVWGMDPYLTMQLRQTYGYTWVPSALMPPVNMAPGLVAPGSIPYDPNNPPAGSIKVTTTSLPPFVQPPVPTSPSAPTSLVGVDEGGGYWSAYAAASNQLKDGQTYADPNGRGTFTYHQAAGFMTMGFRQWFVKD